jgi:hypothetical protein
MIEAELCSSDASHFPDALSRFKPHHISRREAPHLVEPKFGKQWCHSNRKTGTITLLNVRESRVWLKSNTVNFLKERGNKIFEFITQILLFQMLC